MRRGRSPARERVAILALVSAYLVVLAFAPIAHHDFLCHLTSPTHCEACTASPAVSGVERGLEVEGVRTLTTERVRGPEQQPAALPPPPTRTGRAPPV